jgi:ATP-dependent DNA helicase MPH1
MESSGNGTSYDATQELADLPSDAFSSSLASPQKQPDEVILLSSQPSAAPMNAPRIAAPMTGLRQTTLFGRNGATVPPSQVNKCHNWPLANKDEPPTHHKINFDEMQTWVYPTNIGKIRDYQYNIVHRGLFHNLLVALPTGLGKTFIAAAIMLNWYRWTHDAQIIFVAPTKPLVSQQVEACFTIAGIPRSQTTMLTGDVSAGLRADEWKEKRVFFMTPQTLINDLKTGSCDPKRIVLIVIDEAHRATGSYAYVEVVKFVRRFNESFRVLALTATPGGNVEQVQKVIDGLDISRCEIRTEQSIDIREYVHAKDVTKEVFDPTDEMELLFDFYSKAIGPILNVVNGINAFWQRDPLKLTPFGCTEAMRQWSASDAGRHANKQVKGMVYSVMSLLASIAQSLELLKYYSIRCFYDKLLQFRKETREGKSKSKYRKQIDESEPFERMMVRLKNWTVDPNFTGHPKLEQVRATVLQHFIDAGEGANGGDRTATRIEIFSHYRDSVEEIYRLLKRDSPIVRPHVFVGQSAGKNSEGMSQKKQLDVTQKFKSGEYNVLISTSVGEEGLDIGEVDLIICYDSKSSPIRLLQRMGRTGRKREGRVVWLQMKGKEQDDAIKAMDGYEKMQGLIANGDHFTFHHDRSRRIVPKDIQPVVEKRAVDIPIENTQRTPSDFLPVPKKNGRSRTKRPPKKFHMPDGVRTGFTTASRFDDDDDGGLEAVPKVRRPGKKEPVDEAEAVPLLEECLLSETQMKELERRYQSTAGEDEDMVVAKPRADQQPESQRRLGRTMFVGHGRASAMLVETVKRMRSIDEYTADEQEAIFEESFLEPDDVGRTLIESRPASDEEIQEEQQPAPRSRGRPPGATTTKRKPKAPAVRKTAAPAVRKTKNLAPPSSAMEADASSPPPSSPGMAIRSQGINLGSTDTPPGSDAGDGDGYMDSDLEDFVVDDAEPLGTVGSSLLSPSATFKRPKKTLHLSQLSIVESSQELPNVDELFAPSTKRNASRVSRSPEIEKSKPVAKRRRRVVSSDEDE